MSGIQWLLLILVVAAVAGGYWYLRRQGGDDPWQGMDDDDDAGGGEREAPAGDSYIVAVRTLTDDRGEKKAAPAADRPAASGQDEGKGEDFWRAFHTENEEKSGSGRNKVSRVEDLRPQKPPAGEESLFVLHVASHDGSFFDGPDLHAALRARDLKFGQHDIYHRITEVNGVSESVYSVANILKPGFLDPAEEDHLRTPGLALFLVLPGPLEGVRAMRDMLDTAHALADDLNGEVLDDKRTLLTPQTTQYMLDRVAELDRRRRVRAGR